MYTWVLGITLGKFGVSGGGYGGLEKEVHGDVKIAVICPCVRLKKHECVVKA